MATQNATHFVNSARNSPQGRQPFALGAMQHLWELGKGGREDLAAGFWHVTPEDAPEPFESIQDTDENFVVVEGHLTVDVIGGASYELKPGSSIALSKGLSLRWTVHEPTTKFWVQVS